MAAKGILAILAGYYNDKNASNYKPLREFAAEVRAGGEGEWQRELAEGVCALTGDTIKAEPVK